MFGNLTRDFAKWYLSQCDQVSSIVDLLGLQDWNSLCGAGTRNNVISTWGGEHQLQQHLGVPGYIRDDTWKLFEMCRDAYKSILYNNIYICTKYNCRSKGPLQRPPGFQHETPQKFFFGGGARAKDLAKDVNMRPPRKINEGFAKDSQTYFYSRRMAVCR